jgi:hypothetical protein
LVGERLGGMEATAPVPEDSSRTVKIGKLGDHVYCSIASLGSIVVASPRSSVKKNVPGVICTYSRATRALSLSLALSLGWTG